MPSAQTACVANSSTPIQTDCRIDCIHKYRPRSFVLSAAARPPPHLQFYVLHDLPADTETNITAVDKSSSLAWFISNHSRMDRPQHDDCPNCNITVAMIMYFCTKRRSHKVCVTIDQRLWRRSTMVIWIFFRLKKALILILSQSDTSAMTSV